MTRFVRSSRRLAPFGLVVVAVFLTGYYHLAGVVATLAVLLNMVLILGAMAMLGATFTLPGVAGIVSWRRVETILSVFTS